VGPLDIPAFQAPSCLGGQEPRIIARVVAELERSLTGSGVVFTTREPSASQSYSTIYIGGDGSTFSRYGSFLGLAEQVDIGNEDKRDEAFVFSDRLVATSGDVERYAAALAQLVAHEAGHLLGYEHQTAAEHGEGLLDRYAAPRTLYVDPAIVSGTDASGDCPGTYDPATRAGGAGTGTAYNTLMEASLAAVAGDTIAIRGGTYQGDQILRPQHSGSPGLPITYRNYGTESVILRNTNGLSNLTPDEVDADQAGRQYGIYIYDHSYLTLQGLQVTNVDGWARIVNSDHISLVNNDFTVALSTGTTGSVKFVHSDFNEIVNNRFQEGNDNLLLIHSNHNLVADNDFINGRHTLWCIRAGNYNILRGNYFYNALQKIGEIYDAETDLPITFDATKYNVVEGNIFAKTASSGDDSPYAGLQFAGQNCIIRNNVFYETIGPALDLTYYADEALYNYGNRIYGNVFYKTDFAGITIADAAALNDNVFKNNILTQSIFVANDTRWTWYTDDLAGKPVQLLIGRIGGFLFENNDLFNVQAGEDHLITHGTRYDGYLTLPHSVSWWQANYPALFTGNLEAEPGFVDAAGHDYHLAAGSPLIDTGTFLTQTAAGGSGTSLRVADAGYFRDGVGLPAEPGDLIQLEGQTATARITAVDYATNTLTLDRALTWTAGQGVSLAYQGAAPDVGAYEYTAAGNQPPDLSAVPDVLTKDEGTTLTAAEVELATDPEGDPLTYAYSGWLSSLPYNINFSDAGTHTLHVAVSDGTATAAKDIAITVNNVNRAPDLLAVPDSLTKHAGDVIGAAEVQFATDPDGDSLAYSYSNWLTALPYTTTSADLGVHTLRVEASDGTAATAKDITIAVSPQGTAPYSLTVTATHGSVTVSPAKALYEEGEQVVLTPRPETGYCFTGWSGDAQGRGLGLNLTMDSNKTITATFGRWTSPIGIPMPQFGIFETYRMYDDVGNRNPSLTYNASPGGGYYTHYVDSTDPNATNTTNDYGSPEKPRTSIPTTLPEGSVVEIHNSIAGTSLRYITANGTAEHPVFVRGVGSPTITGGILVKGSYSLWEGLTLHTGSFEVCVHNGSNAHHVAIRNNVLYGDGVVGSGTGLQVWGGVDNLYHDIVFYGNHIHHGGDSEAAQENDNHGVAVGAYVENLWIVDNHIHHIGGDSIQVAHGANYTTHEVYIGRNVMHDDRENAVDIKQANHVVVSQNEMWGYEPCSSAPGEVCVVHYDPHYIYWLYNTIHDGNYGIVSTGCSEQYIVGNVIYSITGDDTYTYPYSPHRNGIGIRWYNTGATYVVNNTIVGCDMGIGADVLSYATTIANNLIADVNDSGAHSRVLISVVETGRLLVGSGR
jgi:hypothetical protein